MLKIQDITRLLKSIVAFKGGNDGYINSWVGCQLLCYRRRIQLMLSQHHITGLVASSVIQMPDEEDIGCKDIELMLLPLP